MKPLFQPLRAEHLHVIETDESFGNCECCGHVTRCVWGLVDVGEATVAAYWVRWTEHHIAEHGASLDLCIGAWGDATTRADRAFVSLLYRLTENGGMYMVVDANAAKLEQSDLAGSALQRDEVIGTPLAPQIFAIIDAIHLQDTRLGARNETDD